MNFCILKFMYYGEDQQLNVFIPNKIFADKTVAEKYAETIITSYENKHGIDYQIIPASVVYSSRINKSDEDLINIETSWVKKPEKQ